MWNKEAAISHLNAHAHAGSTGRCAAYTRQAIEAGGGGVILHRKHSAKDFGSSLTSAGFIEQPAGQTPAAGDVVIIQPIPGHPHGHMAMFNGTLWVSDFKQLHGFYPGHSYRVQKPDYKIYRHP